MNSIVKIIAILTLIFLFAGCEKEPKEATIPITEPVTEATQPVTTPASEPTVVGGEISRETGSYALGTTWAVSCQGIDGTQYLINTPELDSVRNDVSVCGITAESRLCVLAGGCGPSESIADPSVVFSACGNQILDTLANSRSMAYENFSMAIEDQLMLEINGRLMCRVRGTYTFDNVRGTSTWRYVGYATTLANGCHAYWLASYDAGEQYGLVKETARNMAFSFTEIRGVAQ